VYGEFKTFLTMCAIAVVVSGAGRAVAQTPEVKEKPPLYSYIGFWTIPRAQWADMEKSTVTDEKLLAKALASGTVVGYGNDRNLVHTPDGPTHDDWWSSMSLAGVLNVLDQFYQSGNTTTPVLGSATRHWDNIYVSRYYNWHSGTIKNGYTYVASYQLKADAPNNAVETLSKSLVVPLLEQQLAAGNIQEYEIDTEAVHTDAPGIVLIVYIANSAEGLDKVNAARLEALKANPLAGPGFGSMIDSPAHRDYLSRTNATYK